MLARKQAVNGAAAVEAGAEGGGVDVVQIEVVAELPGRHLLVFQGRNLVEVDEGHAHLLCHLAGPKAEALIDAHDTAGLILLVGVARRERHEDGVRPQSAGLTHEAAQVFAVAVNGFVFARLLDGDLERIGGGDALDGGAGAPRVEGPVVVVAQLDDDPVAGTDALLHGGPEAAVEGARRGASEGLILHGDSVLVEIFVGKAAPAPLAVVAVAERAGTHRAVAH